MKLYIKQKVFSWNDKFSVVDEYGNDCYTVEGELFSFGKKLHVYDMDGMEVAYIEQKLFTFKPRYHVYICGEQVAEIVKEITFLRPKYRIEGLGWEIDGDFWAHDYQITCDGQNIVTICKEWMTWGDSYELDIAEGESEIMALAVVLCIDCVMASDGGGVTVTVNT